MRQLFVRTEAGCVWGDKIARAKPLLCFAHTPLIFMAPEMSNAMGKTAMV